jgi:hypothetical protein
MQTNPLTTNRSVPKKSFVLNGLICINYWKFTQFVSKFLPPYFLALPRQWTFQRTYLLNQQFLHHNTKLNDRTKDRNSINFTFMAPLWPIQDRVTRAHVRLLDPWFKTGQLDTDLLAIDYSSTHRYHHQHRQTSNIVFTCKTHKGLQKLTLVSATELYAPISYKSRISGELEPVSILKATYYKWQAITLTQQHATLYCLTWPYVSDQSNNKPVD